MNEIMGITTYPESYEITVRPVGTSIKIEARILYRYRDRVPGRLDGNLSPSLISYLGPHPSLVYVDEPCWLFRLFGDTVEKRVERAKRSVERWVIRELERERRAIDVARRGRDA